MKIYGLTAKMALVKRYELDAQGQLVKHPYPEATYFTSHEFDDLSTAIGTMAYIGGCLLKGELNAPLRDGRRAGHTEQNGPTDWICLDLDGVTAWNSVDSFLAAIGVSGVDYIVQWSNSAGLAPGLRCHVFMYLDREVTPDFLKRWLMLTNLGTPQLRSQITLNKIGTALRWPLDVTTCQNDKLLFVAPPILGPGIPDPYAGKQRIEVQRRGRATLSLPMHVPNAKKVQQQTRELITELRKHQGLPSLGTVMDGREEVIITPEAAKVTGCRQSRGFVYFNLNGGDSWAYYHPLNSPQWIRNFKGEPKVLTSEVLPDYWAMVVAAKQKKRPAPEV
jgi:hypothetical protein